MQENTRDRRINATRQSTDDLFVTDLGADFFDHFLTVRRHCPIASEPSHFDKVFQHLGAVRGVVHLGVELNSVELARFIRDHSKRGVRRNTDDLKPRGEFRDAVAVRHPNLFFAFAKETSKDPVAFVTLSRGYKSTAIFSVVSSFDLTAELFHHNLLAVADTKDRQAHVKEFLRRAGRAIARHAVRTTREDHGLRSKLTNGFSGDRLIGVDFAVNLQLTQAARDQLRHLRTEVDDKEALMLGHACGIGPRPLNRKRIVDREMSLLPPIGRKIRTSCVFGAVLNVKHLPEG